LQPHAADAASAAERASTNEREREIVTPKYPTASGDHTLAVREVRVSRASSGGA
jgi:hypothetical protein